MTLDLHRLLEEHRGLDLALLESYVNPRFARVLRLLGFDPTWVRGSGAHLWDERGDDYLDMLAGYGVFGVGRAHPGIRDAIRQYLDLESPNLVQMGSQLLAGVLARRLVEDVAPAGLDTVFLCSSGAEAMETAFKLARCATGRPRMVFCENGYHGSTLGSLSACGLEEFKEGFGDLLPAAQVPFGDADALEAELRRGDVAAFAVEPVQGHGVFVPPSGYLPRVRELCDHYGTVWIADEVQTGLGRTGKLLACEHWGVTPDVLTLSKALSGGFCPVGAVLFRRRIYDRVYSSLARSTIHSSTFSQNDLAAVCALATLDVLESEDLVERSARVGAHLLRGLEALRERYDLITGVRGLGLMIGIELGLPRPADRNGSGLRSFGLRVGWKAMRGIEPALLCQSVLVPLMMDHHILAQVAGRHLDVIKLTPPLVLTEAEADRFLAAFEDVIAGAHRVPGAFWKVGTRLARAALG